VPSLEAVQIPVSGLLLTLFERESLDVVRTPTYGGSTGRADITAVT
jgi:hypothetical protein